MDRLGNKSVVAVFGATGHTGQFVVKELLRRNMMPIAIARNAKALEAAKAAFPDLVTRQATVDDAVSLDKAFEGAQVVINCAGPFADTAEAVAGAAIRAKAHYIDVCAEQGAAQKTLDIFDAPAREAGVVVVPSVAFYGGFADLLATAALGDWDAVDSIEIMIGLDSWHPTRGTRITVDRKAVGNLVVSGGKLVAALQPQQKQWEFGEPLGNQTLVEVPFSEPILISRHIKANEVHNYLSQIAVRDVLDSTTPAPEAVDETGRSAQRFVVEVLVTRDDKQRGASVHGQDIYAVSAPLICEAVERLLRGKFTSVGAHAPGEVFDARDLLVALGLGYTASEFAMA
ncbi:saccharopine dehydrogenase family protein [Paraburkholderia sp. GAS42]|uniref:saccharopine dehydrogenase family protein n=1 Tax=Paraburkholderia sp. GAS42 TaxID=3035135 RepID=UPI003D1D0299